MFAVIVCCYCMLAAFATPTLAKDNLHVVYEWKEIDYNYINAEQRWSAIETREFKPNNVIPFGIEVYQNRLFVTLPRWRDGVPASLAYIDLNVTNTKSPNLIPFPSWEAHTLTDIDPEIVSPFRVRADRCGRLWVLDSRISGVLERTKIYGPAQLLVYDLHNDNLLRRHPFPADQVKQASFFANLAIEDADCENTFAYAGDLGSPGLVVYSWQQEESWRVQHHYFHPDPLSGNFTINDIEFQWDDGLYGLALSETQRDGFATLYFHPLSSTMEFAVSTSILRNKTLATKGEIYREFKVLGERGPDTQAGASVLDRNTDVLFYALPNLNAIACWQTSNDQYTSETQGRVFTSATEMVFPSDVIVDDQDRLWVLSNRLQDFIYDELFPATVNFRIMSAPVKDAIANTPCVASKNPLHGILTRVGDFFTPTPTPAMTTTTTAAPKSAAMSVTATSSLATLAALLAWTLRCTL